MAQESEQGTLDLFGDLRPLPVGASGKDPLLSADWGEPVLRPVRNLMVQLYRDDIRVDIYDALVFQGVTRTFGGAQSTSMVW